jgi:hypothetical protein
MMIDSLPLDHIAVPDFMSCGMENWGMIVYVTFCMIYDPKTDPIYAKNAVANTVIHEVAHQVSLRNSKKKKKKKRCQHRPITKAKRRLVHCQ